MVAIGDLVIIHFDLEYVKIKVNSLKYWDSSMSMYLNYEGNIGRVIEINEEDVVRVEFEDGMKWWFPANCMSKAAGTFSF